MAKVKHKAKYPDDWASSEEEEFASGLIEEEPGESPVKGNRPDSCRSFNPWTVRIIKDQLQTLSSGLFAWHGQVWPEQRMDWSVCERESRNGEAARKTWETSINLELPNMSGVNSILQLNKDGLRVRIRADSGRSADIMQREKGVLAQAISEAGVKLVEMTVEHEEPGT